MTHNRKHFQYLALLPGMLWIALFFIAPLLIITTYGFFTRGVYGQVIYDFDLNHVRELLNPTYASAFGRSFLMAAANVCLCILMAYPVAYYISFRLQGKLQNLVLIAIILPLWTNYLARTYSWFMILSDNGPINQTLHCLHVNENPIQILFTPVSVLIGLLYNYVPFMVLALYVGMEKIDRNLLLAAKDLGATKLEAFKRITLPLSVTGMINGSILVFVFSLSDYIVPNILGGAKHLLISNVIANQFLVARNVPLGALLATALVLLIFACILLLTKSTKRYSNG